MRPEEGVSAAAVGAVAGEGARLAKVDSARRLRRLEPETATVSAWRRLVSS